jgi:hypothetical protein
VDAALAEPFRRFLPHWQLINCGDEMDPGPRDEFRGRANVFVTHPLDPDTPCRLKTTASVPAAGRTVLRVVVGHHPQGDWEPVVRADEKDLLRTPVGPETAGEGWREVQVDLTGFAGRQVRLELLNSPTGWHYEAAYWAAVEIKTTP